MHMYRIDRLPRDDDDFVYYLCYIRFSAGLAVAHALEKSKAQGRATNLEAVVYEQKTNDSTISQYPIHIVPDGRSALQSILNPDEHQKLLVLAQNGITHGGITLHTPRFSKLFQIKQWQGQQPQFVHRGVLNDLLKEVVNMISGKRLLRTREVGEKVEVVFQDGTCELADLVVGADGLGSILRAQTSPQHSRFPVLPFIVVQFKLATPVSNLPGLKDKSGINMILGFQSRSLLLVPFSGTAEGVLPPGSSGAFERDLLAHSDSAIENVQQTMNEPLPSYLFAILTLPVFQGWDKVTPPSWVAKTVELLKKDKASSELLTAFEKDVIPGSVGAWQIVSCEEKDPVPFEGGKVVLIGDACHAMSPFAGAGGSTALKDAELLAAAITSSNELGGTGRDLRTLLQDFHNEMIVRANGHVKDGKRRLYLATRSGLGYYTRMVLLRVMDWTWPLADRVLKFGKDSASTEKPD